jgi:hypothetical protein
LPGARPVDRVLDSPSVSIRRFAIALVLAISIGAPLVELFDGWDHTAQNGTDTEANVVVVALCVGIAFSIGCIVSARLNALAAVSRLYSVVWRPIRLNRPEVPRPTPTCSPPTPLRI